MEQRIKEQGRQSGSLMGFVRAVVERPGIILNSKAFLITELLLLFAGIPLLFFFGLIPFREIVGLLLVTIVCSIWLFGFARVDRSRFSLLPAKEAYRTILVRFAFASGVLIAIFLLLESHMLFSLIQERPIKWALIILLYPLLSVVPQELIYRVFFFSRYKKLFSNHNLLVHVNALAFGFLHIVYANYTAVFLTCAVGYLLGRTYLQTRSFWAVCFEHILYGILIFTIGMGHYFSNGPM